MKTVKCIKCGESFKKNSISGVRLCQKCCSSKDHSYNKVYYQERLKNSEYRLALRLRQYNITPEQYREKIEAQQGCCALCLKPFTKTPHVDHDHKTKRIRGLLCHNCNHGLGSFKDSIALLLLALQYLGYHGNHYEGVPVLREKRVRATIPIDEKIKRASILLGVDSGELKKAIEKVS